MRLVKVSSTRLRFEMSGGVAAEGEAPFILDLLTDSYGLEEDEVVRALQGMLDHSHDVAFFGIYGTFIHTDILADIEPLKPQVGAA